MVSSELTPLAKTGGLGDVTAALTDEPGVPTFGVVLRLTVQKGIDLCAEFLPGMLANNDLRLALLGGREQVPGGCTCM
jgi:glycogen synthase